MSIDSNNISYVPSHQMLYTIYDDLMSTFPKYEIKIGDMTNQRIRSKLETIKQLENEIAAMNPQEIKKQLQIASHGVIDPNRIRDDEIFDVYTKHANILDKMKIYHRKTYHLSDILGAFGDAILSLKKEGHNF